MRTTIKTMITMSQTHGCVSFFSPTPNSRRSEIVSRVEPTTHRFRMSFATAKTTSAMLTMAHIPTKIGNRFDATTMLVEDSKSIQR